jgi:hypothetical protein
MWTKIPKENTIDKDLLALVTRAVAGYIVDIAREDERTKPIRTLSFLEAIRHCTDLPNTKGIDMSTSAGFPYNKLNITKNMVFTNPEDGQRDFIKCEYEDKHMKIFDDYMDKLEDPRALNIDYPTQHEIKHCGPCTFKWYYRAIFHKKDVPVIFDFNLKDEVLKKEKVEAAKTRAIMASPLHFTVACKRYFGAVHALLNTLHDKIPIKIGIDPNKEYEDLVMDLLSKNDEGYCCDWKGWDASVPIELFDSLKIFYDVLFNELGDRKAQNNKVETSTRHLLIDHMNPPYFWYEGTLRRASCGMPSGQAGTAYDNSIMHFILLTYAWFKKHRGTQLCSVKKFMEIVMLALFGDDNVFSVHRDHPRAFGGTDVDSVANEFGMEATDGDKIHSPMPHPISQLDFLSRKLSPVDGLGVTGRLKDLSLFKMLAFCKAKGGYLPEGYNKIFRRICFKTLRAMQPTIQHELSLCGEKFYTAHYKQYLLDLKRNFRINFRFIPFEEVDVQNIRHVKPTKIAAK